MNQNPLLTFLGATAALCLPCQAGVLTWSEAAPDVDGADIANFVGVTADLDNVNGGDDSGCFVAVGRPAVGNTFTTGNDPAGYVLSAVTLQHVAYATDVSGWSVDAGWGAPFEVRVGTKDGTVSFTPIVTESANASVTGNPALDAVGTQRATGTGWFVTFTLDKPVNLEANTTYGFTFGTGGPFFQTNGDGRTSDNYPDGEAFGVAGETVFDYPGDHVFHLDIAAASDIDTDGLPDNWELGWDAISDVNQLDGTISSPVGSGDGSGDWDGDGLSDLEEFELGTDPTVTDSDGDGLGDGDEVNVHGTRPLVADSDGDGLDDNEEVTEGEDGFVTNPNNEDTDLDFLLDGWESANGLDPTDDSGDNGEFGDPDEDTFDNFNEQEYGTDPLDPDSDGDQLSDGEEFYDYSTNPLLPDTDFDGIMDGEEVVEGEDGYVTDPVFADSDDDGVPDGAEVFHGTDPNDELDFPTDVGNFIASVTQTSGAVADISGTHVTGVFFGEDILAFSDRVHQWNGLTSAGLPASLVGGDYVANANNSRDTADFSEDVTLKAPAVLYLLWDDRVALAPWCTDGLGLDFEDTGLDVGWDEEGPTTLGAGAGVSIDNTASVYIARNTADGDATTLGVGTYTFYERGGGGNSMYGIVATAPASTTSGPIRVLSAGFNDMAFEMTYEGLDPGTSYQWQRSSPGLDNFVDIAPPVTPSGSSESFSDPAPPAGGAFYRLSSPD